MEYLSGRFRSSSTSVIYFVFSDDAGKEVENSVAGQLLRTKSVTTDEGGVAAGFAVIDSPVCF